jgi:hypothetical protein
MEDDDDVEYMITRRFMKGDSTVMKRGLTKAEAQEWCRDPETSSRTCTRPELLEMTEKRGPWFDGYDEM